MANAPSVAAVLLAVALPALAWATVPPPSSRALDVRDGKPRPDLVFIEPLGEVDAPSLYTSGEVPFGQWMQDGAGPAMKAAFGKAITAFSPPMTVRIVIRKAKLAVDLGELRVSLDAVVFDVRDRAKMFRDRSDAAVAIAQDAGDGALHTAVDEALRLAAEDLALRFLNRMGAPAPPKPAHVVWAGVELGGALPWGLTAAVVATPNWLAQLAVNPLWPQVGVAAGAARRLHESDDVGLWLRGGLGREFPVALLSKCAPKLCAEQVEVRTYLYLLLELAVVLGDEGNHRVAANLGLQAGALRKSDTADAAAFGRPFGGVGWQYGF